MVRVVRHSDGHRWDARQQPLWADEQPTPIAKKRCVVERTHAWLERNRRLVMHHGPQTLLWAAAGFKDTLLRWKMKPEVV